MDLSTARALSAMTTSFYREVSSSFSATRQAPWPGWRTLMEHVEAPPGRPLRVLDLACGNLRFERFLQGEGFAVEAWCVDSCDALMQEGDGDVPGVHHCHRDLAQALLQQEPVLAGLDVPPCDLCVCFGFLHHLPLPSQREQVLAALAHAARPGGLVAVSLWQFAHDARLLAKATPAPGGERGDYLLGWQGKREPARYCHSFSEDEVDCLALAAAPLAREVARFSADGRSADLNRYLLLRCER